MDRRKLVSLLGLGTATSLSGCAGVIDEFTGDGSVVDRFLDGDSRNATPTPEPAESRLTVLQAQIQQIRRNNPREVSTLYFGYEGGDFRDIPDPNFSRIIATPSAEVPGDQLKIVPQNLDAAELATRLRVIWGGDESVQLERRLRSIDVTFEGGTLQNYTYLVGNLAADEVGNDSGLVLVARGETPEAARTLANDFDLG